MRIGQGKTKNSSFKNHRKQLNSILYSPPPPSLGVYHAAISVTGFQKKEEAELVKLNFQFSSPPNLFRHLTPSLIMKLTFMVSSPLSRQLLEIQPNQIKIKIKEKGRNDKINDLAIQNCYHETFGNTASSSVSVYLFSCIKGESIISLLSLLIYLTPSAIPRCVGNLVPLTSSLIKIISPTRVRVNEGLATELGDLIFTTKKGPDFK